MYAVVFWLRSPTLRRRGIHASHGYVLDRLVAALRQHVPAVARAGTSDIVLADGEDVSTARKFSGNSLPMEADALSVSRDAAIRLRFIADQRLLADGTAAAGVSAEA